MEKLWEALKELKKPYIASIGGEALDPVKAGCPSIGEYQDREAGVNRLVGEHPHRRRLRGK